MPTKRINVSINESDLSTLKSSGYSLCFALMFNGRYTVVWQAYKEFYPNSIFSWENTYKVFATNSFAKGKQVTVRSNEEAVTLGQIITLDSNCIFNSAVDGGLKTAVNIKNDFGSVYPGLFQTCKRVDNDDKVCAPVFLMPTVSIRGTAEIMPADKLLIWFEQDIQAGTMINKSSSEFNARSKFTEVSFHEESEHSIKYENQTWKVI